MRVCTAILATLILALPAAAQDTSPCAFTARTTEVSQALDRSAAAYAGLDVEGFTGGVEEVRLMLPCVTDRFTTGEAANIHRMLGIAAFVGGDESRARESLAAAYRAEPDYRWPPEMVPQSHPIAILYNEAFQSEDTKLELVAPVEGELRFDGELSVMRPTARATVAQLLDDEGGTVRTAYLFSDSVLFEYSADPQAREALANKLAGVTAEPPSIAGPTSAPDTSRYSRKKGLRTGLAMVGIGTVLAVPAALLTETIATNQDEGEVDRAFSMQVITGSSAYLLWGVGGVVTLKALGTKK